MLFFNWKRHALSKAISHKSSLTSWNIRNFLCFLFDKLFDITSISLSLTVQFKLLKNLK